MNLYKGNKKEKKDIISLEMTKMFRVKVNKMKKQRAQFLQR